MSLWEAYQIFSVFITTALFIFHFLNIPVTVTPFIKNRGALYIKKKSLKS